MKFFVDAGFARRVAGVVAVASSLALAATETLFSNWAFSVAPGGDYGSLWVFSRGDMNSAGSNDAAIPRSGTRAASL